MIPIVIDADPGIDDAHAILMALAHPQIQVLAVTTVAGNVPLEQATANALIVLDVAEVEIPVFPGCADALVFPTPRRAISHGQDGLGDSGYPPSRKQPMPEHAALALIRLADQSPGQITLVALGPLTNLSLATRLDPDLPRKFRRLVVMGGAIRGMGNSWTPASEFNFSIDPEAAAIVFQQWAGLELISWETTLDHGLSPQQVEQLSGNGSPRAEFFRRTIQNRYLKQVPGVPKLFEPDPLAMAVAIEPEIVRRSETRPVKIETAGHLARGQSVVDWFGWSEWTPNAKLVLEIDLRRFLELMTLGLA